MSSGIGEFTLRADPERIQSAAGNLKRRIDLLRSAFTEISSKVDSTANYWQGDAAETYRQAFRNEQPDFDEALDRLDEHVIDLHNIAAVYTGAEQIAQGYVETLLTKVIE